MHREVLGGRDQLQVARVVTLQAFDERHPEPTSEVRALAVRLVASAPAWIAENVDIRTPAREPFEDTGVPLALILVVLGACFVRNGDGDSRQQVHIPARSEPDCL